jgi:hypothetical protein
MLAIGSIVSDAATGVGFLAGSIAVGGFIGHLPSILMRQEDEEVALATVAGGVIGLVGALFVIAAANFLM